MDPVQSLKEASALFRSRLEQVPADAWEHSTPCSEWDVRALVNHVVGGEKVVPELMAGKTFEEILPSLAGDQLGADPLAAFEAATAAAIEAFASPAALDRQVHHPAGDMDGRTYIGFRIGDLTVHSWDLARATGGDESLPPALVEAVLAALEPMRPIIGSVGVFGTGPSGSLPDDADPQTRMLDLAGRRP